MKIYEVKQLKDSEIIKRIEEEEAGLVDLRFTHALKNLTNTAKLRQSKKTIARLKTVLNERSMQNKQETAAEGDKK
ncbi:MAG: 50S ribosomal protein L29 [Ignavibacteria bacterium]|nr:50S ribosomal protein L29 [Ignavibacteria bacterium]